MTLWKQSAVTLALIVVAGGGWLVWHPAGEGVRVQLGLAEASEGGRGGGGRPGFGFGGGATLVVTDTVGQAVINDQLTAIGDGAALRSVSINPEVGGRIAEVLKGSGDRVAAGDVIARLDSGSERIALDRARLAVRDAENRVERLTRMQQGNSITQVERSDAESALEGARLQVREAELALDRRTIRAPFAGVLGIVSLEPGTLVGTQNEVARLDDRSDLLVEFRVPERFVGAVSVGRDITVTPVSNPGALLEGSITAIDSRLEPDSRTLRVQALVDNEADQLRPGMSFVLEMRFPGDTFATVNPLAVQWRSEGSYVWRINDDDSAERVDVRIIQRNSDAVLVDAPLQPGDAVVTEGVQSVRAGATVRLADGG
ncbi:efflux RND transporter periplasmic adaptor subunit [Saccharospirillum impatiens]|uniref:efflux RND transporter periplasmic adaptor subunit n=1 Tax=Saccharospirillum impatiens TaxID=169438 RepID=UPI000422CC42|nr:efflux RND transporter periplasmic adaptor subunit [Saccharospirillum impatiens]